MQITYVPISKLKPNEKNPRKIVSDQFEKLCKNIESDPDFLAMRPLLVNKTDKGMFVYAGNQRLQALKKLKRKDAPCIVLENVPHETIKKRVILDNLHHGEHDFDLLSSLYEVDELLDLGMLEKELGIITEIANDTTEEDTNEILEPSREEDAITQLGDVWQLNEHRIACGDSTMPDVVEKCLNGATPILMVTDPPYGVEYDPNWRGKAGKGQKASGKVQNDDKINWALAWHLFPGSVAYVWCASWYLPDVAKSIDDAEFERKSLIIWAKQHFALSRGDYHWQHEPCWYAIKKGHQHNWQGSRKESTLWEIANLNCFGKSKEDGEERTAHSTQKPIECMAKPIRNNTAQGECVYDPFLGSGTTLIAAEQLNRVCYGIELSRAYCDIIVNRWKNFMGKAGKEFKIFRNGEEYKG